MRRKNKSPQSIRGVLIGLLLHKSKKQMQSSEAEGGVGSEKYPLLGENDCFTARGFSVDLLLSKSVVPAFVKGREFLNELLCFRLQEAILFSRVFPSTEAFIVIVSRSGC